ncbi:MAG: hypothetical protein ACTHNP_09180 [Solirubrobacterales bacterium]
MIAETFQLYRRYPLLFLVLAAGVLVPYELIVLAATGTDPFNRATSLGFAASQLLMLIDWVLVNPLVSALHVHAVADIEEGRTPQIGAVARRGLAVLPVVAVTALVTALGFFGGLVLLVIPGIILWLRWQVASQAAAIEHEGWRPALRRSWSLTEANVTRVFFFLVCIGGITLVPWFLIGQSFTHHRTTALAFLLGTALRTLTFSFTALGTALLYYDLRARRQLLATESERDLTQGVAG